MPGEKIAAPRPRRQLTTRLAIDELRSARRSPLSRADEPALHHHFDMNYTPINTESGRRLARR